MRVGAGVKALGKGFFARYPEGETVRLRNRQRFFQRPPVHPADEIPQPLALLIHNGGNIALRRDVHTRKRRDVFRIAALHLQGNRSQILPEHGGRRLHVMRLLRVVALKPFLGLCQRPSCFVEHNGPNALGATING